MAAWGIILFATIGVHGEKHESPRSLFVPETASSLGRSETLEKPSKDWSWLPWWREKGDCGPLALFVLMKLEGKQVTVHDIKRLTPFDPEQGCSLHDLCRTSEKLGMLTEVRFVKPSDLSNLPHPFILHGVASIERNLGHFVVIVDYDPDGENYAVIDPIRESFAWSPEASVHNGYSGYVLVPMYPSTEKWNSLASCSLLFAGGGLFSIWFYRTCRFRRHVAPQS